MIKVNELFAGIGAFRKALERLNIPHEIVGISEIDKYGEQRTIPHSQTDTPRMLETDGL